MSEAAASEILQIFSFLLDIPAICSFKPIEQQGPNSQPGNIRIKSGDEGLHLNLMFDFR